MKPAKQNILIIHNTYLHKGGEDTVVKQEIAALEKGPYQVYYQQYSNGSLTGNKISLLAMPFHLFFNWYAFLHTWRLVKKHRIKTVHVHNFFYKASPAVLWGAKAAGARTVLTLHNYRLFCLNGMFFRDGSICQHCHQHKSFRKGVASKCFKSSTLFSMALASSTNFHRFLRTWETRVDHFIIINPLMRGLLEDIGVAPEKITLKPNFVAPGTIDQHPPYQQRKDFYLFVGRLSEEKGIRHMIQAFEISKKKLIVVGEGELAHLFSTDPTSSIQFHGFKNKAELVQLYASCKALIFPSLWLEGMPMTIIEAASTGAIPIVAGTDNSRQIIRDNLDGFIYEAGNPDSLNAVIDTFEQKTMEELNALSSQIHTRFQAEHTEQQHLQKIAEIYQPAQT